jgi:hypothetical protein
MLIRTKFRKQAGRHDGRQSGYAMLIILFMLVLLTYAVIRAAPSIAQQIRRYREEELIHRGKQYAIAIRRFYKKFGRYPNTIAELKETNHIRFLRREYKDPMTDSGEWRLIHLGEPIELTGLFGNKLGQPTSGAQPLTGFGSPIAGVSAPAMQNNNGPSATGTDANASNNSGQNAAGAGTAAGGSNNGGQNSSAPSSSTTQPSGNTFGSGGFGSSSSSSSNPTLGGGPIIGVASTSTAKSIMLMNGKDHYNDWKFFYDPRMDVPLAQVTPLPGAAGSQNPGNQNQGIQNPGTQNPAGNGMFNPPR